MTSPSGTGLQWDAVGLMSVLFMSVTNMAPGAAVAFSILFAAPCVSCISYYLRAQRAHFNPLLHLAIPLVGALALIPVLLAAFGIDFAHLGITGLTYPADLAPFICLAWMVVGFILLGYLMVRDRSRIAETRRVFTEQTPDERREAA